MLAARVLWSGASGIDHRLAAGMPLRVGYGLEPPYALIDESGELRGESIEVLGQLLARMQIANVEYVRLDFGSLIEELEAGRIDLIAGGMFITPERGERVLFSRPTASVQPALLKRATSTLGRPFRLAVIEGSVEAAAPSRFHDGELELLQLPDARSAMAALSLGEADGLALSAPSLSWMHARWAADQEFELRRLDDAEAGYPAFAVARGEDAFIGRLDAHLADYLGSPAHLALAAGYGLRPADITPIVQRATPP